MSGKVVYRGTLNWFLKEERLRGINLIGVVDYFDSEGSKRHEGKFKLEMFGGIVLIDANDNSIGSVIPSQVIKATGESPNFSKGNSFTYDPKTKKLVFRG